MRTATSVTLFVVLCTVACGATGNPSRPIEPAPWTLSLAQGAERAAPEAPEADSEPRVEPGVEPAPAPQAGAPGPAAAPAAQAPAGEAPILAVATVAGQPIDARELFAQWLHRSSAEVLDELDQLVMERMIELEAARHGIAVEPEEVEQAFERAVATITRELVRGRPGTTLDEYVRRSLGLDPATYRERLRRGARRALLGERVFRTHLLTSEHAWARMIVVREEEQAETIRRELERGGDFASLARTHSIDGEEEERGQPVPVVKGDTLMSRLVFQTPLGEVAGPVLEQGAYLLVKVEQRPEPLAGGWPDVRAAVEASLAATPVQELEITQWKGAMLRRYDADLSPFLRLAGEPEPHEER